MSTKFDQARFDNALDAIEEYLGYLKGNELAWEYLRGIERLHLANAPSDGTYQKCVIDYRTPCPKGPLRLEFDVNVLLPPGEDKWGKYDEYTSNTDIYWRKGATWAAGVAAQVRSITAQITEPDVVALTDAVSTMESGLVGALAQLAMTEGDLPTILIDGGEQSPTSGDWAGIASVTNAWHGAAADEFRELYRTLGDHLAWYTMASAQATAEAGAATAIIASAQAGLIRTVVDIEKNLKAQLERWKSARQWPSDGSVGPMWILDIFAIAKMIKVARLGYKFLTNIDNADEYFRKFLKEMVLPVAVSAIGGDPGEEKPFKAQSADEALRSLTESMRDLYMDKFRAALDNLGSSAGTETMTREIKMPPMVKEGESVTASGDSYPG